MFELEKLAHEPFMLFLMGFELWIANCLQDLFFIGKVLIDMLDHEIQFPDQFFRTFIFQCKADQAIEILHQVLVLAVDLGIAAVPVLLPVQMHLGVEGWVC